MMGLVALAVQTVMTPRMVARRLLALNPGREALWTGFALAVVLNALIFGISVQIAVQDGSGLLQSTPVFLALQAVTLAATIAGLTWAGRGLGGVGRMQDVALLMIWLQALRVLGQAAILLLMLLAPALGALLVGLATVLGVWISVHFIDEAHGFANLWKAGATLILGVLGAIIALSVILTLAGVDPNKVTGYV